MEIPALFVLGAALTLGACQPDTKPAAPQPTPTPVSSLSQGLDRLKEQTDRVLDATKQKLEEFAKRFAAERETYQKKFDRQLKQLEPRLEEMRKRAEAASEQARPEIQRNLKLLEEKAQRLRERLERLRSSSAQDWEEIKKTWRNKDGEEENEEPPRAESTRETV